MLLQSYLPIKALYTGPDSLIHTQAQTHTHLYIDKQIGRQLEVKRDAHGHIDM